MIDQQTKKEIDLITEAADRMAKRMGATFVRDPAKVQNFPISGDDDDDHAEETDSEDDTPVIMT